jgi:enolase
MWNMEIVGIKSRMILDSRGNPTVECDVLLSGGGFGRASVPSGASTGSREALELRDGGDRYGGKGVDKAVGNINDIIAAKVIGIDASRQADIDGFLNSLDGTDNKSGLGANAILAVSIGVAKAAARGQNLPLWQYLSNLSGLQPLMPLPMINIWNGGAHAGFATDIQEYMILPHGPAEFSEKLRVASEIYHTLGGILKDEGYPTTLGDEGGYAPFVKNGNLEPLFTISKAVQQAGYKLGQDISLGVDVAASEFFDDGWYKLKTDKKQLSNGEMIGWYKDLAHQFPIVSVEDGLAEDDWAGWSDMTAQLGAQLQIVGDDLLVTNVKYLEQAIEQRACNAILVKPNQIGTVSETIATVKLAKANNFNTIISHRSGETEDPFIAHLAVGLGAGQIKTGSLARGERTAKYNELLRIAVQLQTNRTESASE